MDQLAESALEKAAAAIAVARQQKTGRDFVRHALCLGLAGGDHLGAADLAQTMYPSSWSLEAITKAAVSAGSTTSDSYSALAGPQRAGAGFIAAIRPATILGRLIGTRPVPMNQLFSRLDTGSSFGWVIEGQAKPVRALSLGENINLPVAKIAGVVVISDELLRHSEAEAILTEDLQDGVIAGTDFALMDPATAETEAYPAGLLNGLTPITSQGGTPQEIALDVAVLVAALVTAGSNLAALHFICPPAIAIGLSLMRDDNGAPAFPGVTINGGILAGAPLVVSGSAPSGTLTALDASVLLVADPGIASVQVSTQGSLEMETAPSMSAELTGSPLAPVETNVVSLYQSNSIAYRIERAIRWKLSRPFVAYISALTPTVATVA